MPEYELRLRFTAADSNQAERLAAAWADTCAAEYGTRYAGLGLVPSRQDKLDAAVHQHFDEQHLDTPVAGRGATCSCGKPFPEDGGAEVLAGMRKIPTACEWCGRAIRHVGEAWWAVKGEERGYQTAYCDAADDLQHHPSATTSYGASDE